MGIRQYPPFYVIITLRREQEQYVRTLKLVLVDSYRRLEQFLAQDCCKNVQPLTLPEVRALFTILSNVHNKFEEEDSFTFRKFVKIAYGI